MEFDRKLPRTGMQFDRKLPRAGMEFDGEMEFGEEIEVIFDEEIVFCRVIDLVKNSQ